MLPPRPPKPPPPRPPKPKQPTGQPSCAGQERGSPCCRASGWCMIPG